jgi:hypothetical protein
MTYIPKELRRIVAERARGCCEYCHIGQADALMGFSVDHVIAEKHRGRTSPDNLCLSCYFCNSYKGSDIGSLDPDDEKSFTPLYNPRKQVWSDHFRLNGALIEPLTAEGRTTAFLLRFNEPQQLAEREVLIRLNRYPCGNEMGPV